MVGYVEAVATRPDRQGEGIGRRVMATLQDESFSRWPVALLSTGRATGFTTTGVVPDGDHGGIMILRADPAEVPDLSVSVTCEDRVGDAW
jgi:aminoglycoside 2'-N-acetyltransferase I